MAINKNQFLSKIKSKCNGFSNLEEKGLAYDLNESTTRSEYIDKFFEALGWDVYNEKQDPPNSKEVLREENPSEEKQKKPDYIFRVGGIPHFIVEAKKPKEDLQKNKKHIFQAKKYAYSASIPIAILTDFEEFRVYDCTIKPIFEAPERGLIKEIDLKYKEYIEKSNLIYSLFSFREVANGSLMQLLSKIKKDSNIYAIDNFLFKLKGTEPLSETFLEDLTLWRDNLARDIISHNSPINEELLNEATQRLLDRLIFIRVCEDRGIEEEEILKKIVNLCAKDGGELIEYLVPLFKDLKEKYNGLIFAEHPVEKFKISNKTLNDIISNLYSPNCAYQFDVIDVRILGHIYEKFLEKKIRLLAENKIDIVESKEFRKEEGIYYTNTLIVDYILKNTLGKKLEEIDFSEIGKLKVLDIACGSGSFLIAAFQMLIDYYKNYYQKHSDKANKEDFYETKNGEVDLTIQKKAQIVLDNLFGVDKDSQAVEFTCLSLYLKVLEGEYSNFLFKYFHLPELSSNVKCGNSLIDYDIFDSLKTSDFFVNIRKEYSEKYKPLSWKNSFGQIFEQGKFDVIITNPPYGAEFDGLEKSYFEKYYSKFTNMKNSALLFMNKIDDLLKPGGFSGLIVPKSLAFSQKWKTGRELIKDDLIRVADAGKAWKEVKLEQLIYISNKNVNCDSYEIDNLGENNKTSFAFKKSMVDKLDVLFLEPQSKLVSIGKKLILGDRYLKNYSKTTRGLPLQSKVSEEHSKYKIYRGAHIERFKLLESKEYLQTSYIEANLNKEAIDKLKKPKIISQRIVAHRENQKPKLKITSTLDLKGILTLDTVENTFLTSPDYSLYFILSLLNSKLIAWYAYYFIFASAIRSMDLDDYYIGKIPLIEHRIIDKKMFEKFVISLMELYKETETRKGSSKNNRANDEINYIENKINTILYDYYGLDKKEIAIIEDTM